MIVSNKWKARLAVCLLAVFASMGCNPILLTARLLNPEDPQEKAEFPLTPHPKREKEEVRVVVLTSCALGISPDLNGSEHLLAAEVIPLLAKRCEENKEKVLVFKSAPLEEYKRDHPEWRSMHPKDIGKDEYFKADYVIDIEILEISIYEPRSKNQLLRGRAKIALAAYDCSKPLKEAAFPSTEMNFEFPRTHEVSVYDVPASTFRQKFIKRIAADLVVKFTAHNTDQRMPID